MYQPIEVRLFARLKRKCAKNDRIDARIIAAATAQVDAVKAAADPRISELAERMTAYEQAADLLIRMPELGAMAKGEPASLLGVSPFDHDSGKMKGQRCIAGGRARLRRLVYLAALAARRCDPAMKAFADRLAATGKKPKAILVAIMRKIIEAANLVLKRGRPGSKQAPIPA